MSADSNEALRHSVGSCVGPSTRTSPESWMLLKPDCPVPACLRQIRCRPDRLPACRSVTVRPPRHEDRSTLHRATAGSGRRWKTSPDGAVPLDLGGPTRTSGATAWPNIVVSMNGRWPRHNRRPQGRPSPSSPASPIEARWNWRGGPARGRSSGPSPDLAAALNVAMDEAFLIGARILGLWRPPLA
jgi:hypothetical protein